MREYLEFQVSCCMFEGFRAPTKEADFVRDATALVSEHGHKTKYMYASETGTYKSRNFRMSHFEEVTGQLSNYENVAYSDHGIHGTRDYSYPFSVIAIRRNIKIDLTRMIVYLPFGEHSYCDLISRYRKYCTNIYIFDEFLMSNVLTYFYDAYCDNSIRGYNYSKLMSKSRVNAWQNYLYSPTLSKHEKLRDVYDVNISNEALIRSIYEAALQSRAIDQTKLHFKVLSDGQARLDIEKPIQDAVRALADRLGVLASSPK